MTDRASLKPSDAFLIASEEQGIAFDEGDLERLGRYLALLAEANQAFNLTAITDPPEMWMRHIFDSLTLMAALADLSEGTTVVDVGSGGGAPGLPLAIMMPKLRFSLVESTRKKAAFLADAAKKLSCENVDVVSERAEILGEFRSGHRETYDVAIARAVGRIAVVAELTIPLVKEGGLVLLIKGQKADEELEEARRALDVLHAECAGIVETPTGRIVVLEKVARTPRLYPRRPGEPKRAPLGC